MKDHLGLIEMLFVFGLGLGFVLWELLSVLRVDKKKPKDRDPPGNSR
jgi:hypothetical protein